MPRDRTLTSEDALYRALVDLVMERGFERTRVEQILRRSGVGRATFYAHFRSKEDLLLHGMDRFRDELKAHMGALDKGLTLAERLQAFGNHAFAHAAASVPLFRAMEGHRSGDKVVSQLHVLLAAGIREELRNAGGPAGAPLEPRVQFLAGGLVSLLRWWFHGGGLTAHTEVAGLWGGFIRPLAEALDRPVGAPTPTPLREPPPRSPAARTSRR